MSVNRPQTYSLTFAILTLFAAAAWGQQEGDTIPTYESENSIFGADSLSKTDLFQKTALESDIKPPTPANTRKSVSGYDEIDSLFGSSTKPLVNKDGYFIPAGGGDIWKDVTVEPQRPHRWAKLPKLTSAKPAGPAKAIKQSEALDSVVEPVAKPVLENTGVAETQSQNFDIDNLSQSKLRLRIGFDILLFQRSRGENTVFATNDDGNEWAFSDFDLSEGNARYFIQYMGDDQSGFEFTFYDFNSFSSSIDASGDNVLPFFFQALPANQANSYDLNYSSRLKNIELNSWFRNNQIQRTGWGLRHINLDESFDVVSGFNSSLSSRTNNDLWGVNRMWERRRPMLNRMTFTAGADAGVYLNRAQIDVDTLNVDDSSDATNIAGTLGFNLGVEYLVADHVTLRLGYEGFGIFGAALGSTQSLDQQLLNGLDDPILGSVYFGGFYIGAIAAF